MVVILQVVADSFIIVADQRKFAVFCTEISMVYSPRNAWYYSSNVECLYMPGSTRRGHALQVRGVGMSEISVTQNKSIIFRDYKPLQHRPDNFFHRVLVYTLYHKKNWIKKNIPAWRSIHSKATPMAKNLTKLWRKISEKYFLENSMKISKNQKFWFFDFFSKISSNFRENIFRKFFGQVLSDFWSSALRLSELISKVECSFWSSFFCATRYTLVVYGKNCLGDVAMVYTIENITLILRNRYFRNRLPPTWSTWAVKKIVFVCPSILPSVTKSDTVPDRDCFLERLWRHGEVWGSENRPLPVPVGKTVRFDHIWIIWSDVC